MSVSDKPDERPGPIHAVPPPRQVVAVILVLLITAMLIEQLINNPAFDWPFTWAAMVQPPVVDGFIKGTLIVTILAMIFGVGFGVVLSIMRLSPNPVLRGVAFAYTWFFRAIPRYVLLTILGGAGVFFAGGMIPIGIPYDTQIMEFFGIDATLRIGEIDANKLFTGVLGAALGLGLSRPPTWPRSRSGIISVDKGQTEAAQALGMTRSRTMRHRPSPRPCGSSSAHRQRDDRHVQDTSLLSALPLATGLFFQMRAIGTAYYKMMPVFVGATIYYLAATTVLMIAQSRLERHFGRGYAAMESRKGRKASDTTAVDFPGSDH